MQQPIKYRLLRLTGVLLLLAALGVLVHIIPAHFSPEQIHRLHLVTFYGCLVTSGLVFIALFYSLYRFRQSQSIEQTPFHPRWSVEVIWTLIPFIILIVLIIPVILALVGGYHRIS